MFTGIITEIGKIKKILRGSLKKVEIQSKLDLKIGDSIAVDGVCLTIIAKKKNSLTVEIAQDTYKRTTLGNISVGKKVNLEAPLKVGDYLSGHLVLGHVDTTTRIRKINKKVGDLIYYFDIPPGGKYYIVPMGSVTIDGISLTVKNVDRKQFNVTLIPQTIKETTIAVKKVGDEVNIEYDLIARYTRN